MAQKAQNVSSTVAASIISLIVGGVVGFYIQSFAANKAVASTTSQGSGPGGGGSMRGGGGGGFGGGGTPSPGADLARIVRNLDTVQKVQGAGLSPTQDAAMAQILTKIKSSPTISETDAKADADAIQQILTPAQKDALTTIQPPRGGRGGRGGGPGGPGGGGGFGGGGGGRGAQDPTKPFASGRAADALDSLIAATGKH